MTDYEFVHLHLLVALEIFHRLVLLQLNYSQAILCDYSKIPRVSQVDIVEPSSSAQRSTFSDFTSIFLADELFKFEKQSKTSSILHFGLQSSSSSAFLLLFFNADPSPSSPFFKKQSFNTLMVILL